MNSVSCSHCGTAQPSHVLEYFVDPDEAAAFLKVDRKTVLRWAREGKIPAHPLDPTSERKEWRFLLSELDAQLRSQVNSASHPCRLKGRIQ